MLLAVGIAALLAGSRSYAAIGEWVIDQPSGALEDLGVLDGSRPEKSCLRRLFFRVDADALDRVLGAWMFTRTAVRDGRRVIAIDGKTVRGARTGRSQRPPPGRRPRPRYRQPGTPSWDSSRSPRRATRSPLYETCSPPST